MLREREDGAAECPSGMAHGRLYARDVGPYLQTVLIVSLLLE